MDRVDERKVRVHDCDLHVRTWGSGPPLLLIHGGPGASGAYWWPHLAPMGDHRTVIAVDLRGHGESERAPPYTIQRFVGDLKTLMATLGHDRYELLGHSFGACIALELALVDDHCQGLVLVGPFYSSRSMIVQPRGIWSKLRVAAILVDWNVRRLRGDDQATRELLPRLLRAGQPILGHGADGKETRREYVTSAKPPFEAVAPLQWELVKWSITRKQAHRITVPTLVVVGTRDGLGAPHAHWFARHLPRGEVAWFEGCGHSPFMEDTKAFHGVVVERFASWRAPAEA